MKIDFKKNLSSYKAKKGQFSVIEVPKLSYLMIDGANGPASRDFSAAIETLYPVAYNLKFMSKQTLERDYVVPPLEALWWADDMSVFTTKFDKSQWLWSAMIMTPDWISAAMVDTAIAQVATKKSPPSLDKLRLEHLTEATCVQTLHVGPYDNEGPTLATMHESFIPEHGFAMVGKRHEIYFNDFRKVAPEKLRTILRQPVRSS